jgi:alpha-L-arabinofuranosidase
LEGWNLRLTIIAFAVAVVLAMPFTSRAQNQAHPGSVKIHVDVQKRAGYKIPRSIFGTFLEPIGNSIYNGLWAEVLQNPSFEDNLWSASNLAEMLHEHPELVRSSELTLPLPWEPLYESQGARYAPEPDDAANSSRSVLLMALPDHESGVRQRVFLPVHRVRNYVGSVYLKHISGPAEVEISIRRRDDPQERLAKQQLVLSGADWRRYEYSLEIPAGRILPLEPADYVIAADRETRVLVDQASLLPADNIDGMDPEMITMARELKSPIVRFGGNFTSAYHWRDGIGAREKRRSVLNAAWGMPEYNQFGTDEFLRFCQLINAEPQIALNLGTGTPEEAAEWVQYVNSHWGDHAGGLLWELGNELWGNFQVGYPTLPRVADRTKLFSDAVRRVDPKARLIATGADADNFRLWNEAQLSNAPRTFNFLSTHFVVTTSSTETLNADHEFTAEATLALPIEIERRLRNMHDQIESTPGQQGVKTAFTEWLFWAASDTYPRYDNLGGAIATGGFLNMLLRTADIVPIADMTGIIEFGGVWKKRGRPFGTPAYWVFRMYSNAEAEIPLEVAVSGESYNVVRGQSRLPSIAAVPYLDVFAALNNSGKKLTLFCVNRDLSRDLHANIQIPGFRATPEGHAKTVHAESIYEKNDEVQPELVHPYASEFPVSDKGFDFDFTHASVTVIELQRAP